MAGDAIIATLALGGMCLLMWWLARLARKRMGVGAGTVSASGLRVVGKRPLDQKHSMFVVEIAGGRHILLGASMDGSVSKLDDISPEEYAAMVDEPKAPKLRVATDDEDGDSPVEEQQRFATVGESFQLLLGKAKDARSSRRASGD